mmetsp:Transcript_9033/g.8478  ORF Transcript_9033/g.8478 Transcript_9033/m.8478 type:complete len:141 (-) Transcript_9033:1998-2420(-)
MTKPILPAFDFKNDQTKDHLDVNCENCGAKTITGNCYRCANCEDYNLCEACYTQGTFNHFSYHIFIELHKPLKASDKNPISLLQVLDPCLYSPESQGLSEKELKMKLRLYNADIIGEEELGDNFEDLAPLSMARSLSMDA